MTVLAQLRHGALCGLLFAAIVVTILEVLP
jgi:hypothetical protein